MENKNDIETRRAQTLDELRAALAELESGEELTRFVGGHGIQSQVFEFEWSERALEVSIFLPYARALADEESQKEDNDEIAAAIKMAILLLSSVDRIASTLRIAVSCNDRGTSYAVYSTDLELEDSGEDWTPLVRRFESELADSSAEPLSVIWP